MAVDFEHPLVGRIAVYRDPWRDHNEQGPITSVNAEADLVFVRYGAGTTSAATSVTEGRTWFLDGRPLTRDSLTPPAPITSTGE